MEYKIKYFWVQQNLSMVYTRRIVILVLLRKIYDPSALPYSQIKRKIIRHTKLSENVITGELKVKLKSVKNTSEYIYIIYVNIEIICMDV